MHEEITEQRREVPEHLRCRHIFIDGHRCGSYALRNENYCYFHHEKRKPAPDPQARYARRNSINLPKPTSRAAIQEAIGKIITYLAFNDIDRRRAGLLLYALQIATLNLDHHNQEKQKQEKQKQPKQEPAATAPNDHQPATKSEQTEPDDSFFEDAFAASPALHPLRRETVASMLEGLARHHGILPSPGSPEDRKPASAETILSTLQAESPTTETKGVFPLERRSASTYTGHLVPRRVHAEDYRRSCSAGHRCDPCHRRYEARHLRRRADDHHQCFARQGRSPHQRFS